MNLGEFIRVMSPVWGVEAIISITQLIMGSEELTVLGISALVMSGVALPFIAGFLIAKARGGMGLAVLGAVSISLISFIVAGVGFIFSAPGWLVFSGYVISIVMFGVIPQVIFGGFGGAIGRRLSAKAA